MNSKDIVLAISVDVVWNKKPLINEINRMASIQ